MPDQPRFQQPLPDLIVELIAQRFRVLAERMRIKLLDWLRDGEASVGELQAALGASQQNISQLDELDAVLQSGPGQSALRLPIKRPAVR